MNCKKTRPEERGVSYAKGYFQKNLVSEHLAFGTRADVHFAVVFTRVDSTLLFCSVDDVTHARRSDGAVVSCGACGESGKHHGAEENSNKFFHDRVSRLEVDEAAEVGEDVVVFVGESAEGIAVEGVLDGGFHCEVVVLEAD